MTLRHYNNLLSIFATVFAFQAVSSAVFAQNPVTGYSSIAPTTGDYSPYTSQNQNAGQPIQPLGYPQYQSAQPIPQPNPQPMYGGMPVAPTEPQPQQQFPPYPQYQNPNSSQPVQPIQPFQPAVPQGYDGIQREQAGLAESNPVFDGEVDRMVQGMQDTDPSHRMHTFSTGTSEMIPQGIEGLRPIESERDTTQLQSQVFATPISQGGGVPMFGAATESSLTDTSDEMPVFDLILQSQRQIGDSSFGASDWGQNSDWNQNSPLPYDDNQSRGRVVDLFDKKPVDPEAENLMVTEVIIEGNGKVPENAIRHKIKTMAGYPFRLQTVQEDARTLNQTGSFHSVTPRYQRKADGVIVRFDLVERPIFHSVQFVGNHKIHRRKLEEQAGIKEGDPVDPQMVLQAREKLKEFYRSEGFERAGITIGAGDRLSDRNVVFIVNEGVRQRVLSTTIEGAYFLSNMRMKTYIDSKPGVFYYIGGEFSREKIDADVEKLLDFYQRHGFFNVQIDRVFEETTGYWGISEPGSWIKVKFVISEGPRFKINDVKFLGNNIFTEADLAKEFKLKPGSPYLQGAMDLDRAAVGRKYSNNGYLLTRVDARPRLLADKPGMVDIVYAIRESKLTTIDEISVEFAGDEAHTKISTLLKYLAGSNIKPGRVATGDSLKRAESSLSRNGFLNTNPMEGQVPKIYVKPIGGDLEFEDEDFLDMQLREIDDLTIRGQSPDGISYNATPSALDPRDWRRIQQRNGVGVHPGFPESEAFDYVVCYSQWPDDYTTPTGSSDTPLYGSNPYGTSQFGVQQGGYTVPPYQSPSSTVQAGTVPRLPIDTNDISSTTPALGFGGQNNGEPNYGGMTVGGTYGGTPVGGGVYAPSSPYGNNGYNGSSGSNGYNDLAAQSGVIPTTPSTTATPYNPIIPATTNPNDYFGDNGYGSVTQASGLLPSAGSYNDLGAPGSIMRDYNDPVFGEYARAKAVLRVQEGKTGNLTMSVGINSDSGLVGRFSIEERNFDWRKLPTNPFTIAGWRNAFRGAGQRFLIEAMPGQNYQRYSVSFQEPLLGSTRFSLGLNGFYYTRYYDEWRENRAGGGVQLGRAWTDRFSTALSFNAANIRVYDPQIPIWDLFQVLGDNAQYAFGISGTYDSRDNGILPTEGGTLTVNAEQVIGTHQFIRGGYDARRYFSLWQRGDGSGHWVLGLRSVASITEESKTPIYERYYAGGFSTIRGFEYRGVTPRIAGYGVGGNFEFYNSVELCFPISADDNFRGVFFVDSGTVESSISKWDSNYRIAPGFGIRLSIPMMGPVPIAFDFAFPINPNTGDVTQMFSFNMGFTR